MLSNDSQVSIVVTTFNGEKYLNEQLTSILNQTHSASEIIICDDHSEDSTTEIINKFTNKHPEIRWIVERNDISLGFRENFYKAINLATCNIIFLCDQDDVWYQNKISDMISILTGDQHVKVLVSDFDFLICENGQPDYNASKRISVNEPRNNNSNAKVKYSIQNFLNKRPGWTFAFKKEIIPLINELRIGKKEIYHDEIVWYAGLFLDGLYHINKPLGQWRRFNSSVTKIDGSESKRSRFLRLLPVRLKRADEYLMLAKTFKKNNSNISNMNKTIFYLYFQTRYYVIWMLNGLLQHLFKRE